MKQKPGRSQTNEKKAINRCKKKRQQRCQNYLPTILEQRFHEQVWKDLKQMKKFKCQKEMEDINKN